MKRAICAAAFTVLTGAAGAGAEPPLCSARRVLEPSEAFVGQPVLQRVLIERRHDVTDVRWEVTPSYPALRDEWIPTRTLPGSSEATKLQDERRVLFPARAGTLLLPAAQLVCESAERMERISLAATSVVVHEPPAAGRPATWTGLIGPVEVRLRVTPDRITLGEAATISVVVQGETNVWVAETPLRGAFAVDEAELFERPAELARDTGRGLVLRRYFGFDLVPRRAGRLTVPEVRLPYFDPVGGRYEEARAPAVAVTVVAAAPTAGAVEEPRPLPAATRPPGTDTGIPWLLVLAGAAALAAAGWAWRRRARRAREPDGGIRLDTLRDALGEGDIERAAAAATRALREALEPALPGALSRAVEELGEAAAAGDAGTRERVALLARLEAARFGAGGRETLLALAREAEVRLGDR
ncbi:MAG: hypothetical protein ABFS41_02235 [Myxococcota bacterium]